MKYQEVVRYLESFVNYEKVSRWPYKQSLKLERFKAFLTTIDNPQNELRCIHVAGSKGKGSTCAFITYILREAGFKVGLYTSPHLCDFRERIRILLPRKKNYLLVSNSNQAFEGMIQKFELIRLVKRLKPEIEKFNRSSPWGRLSFFEVYTALAFLYFKDKKVDFVVLETGLGGRLDATNAANSIVSVITPISYEHTQKLGLTLKAIAYEKAGIIKSSRQIVVSSRQKKEALQVIRKRCRAVGTRLYEHGRDLQLLKNGSQFKFKGIFGVYQGIRPRLLGQHQRENALVALGAVECLRNFGIFVPAEAIRRGVNMAFWPGRCEVVGRKPWIVLDGAQNVASCLALKKAIKGNFKYRRLLLILGISQDKDIEGVCRVLNGLADKVILTQADNPRAAETVDLLRFFPRQKTIIAQNSSLAFRLAQESACRSDLILVTGSLFLVGEIRSKVLS